MKNQKEQEELELMHYLIHKQNNQAQTIDETNWTEIYKKKKYGWLQDF